VKAAENFIYFAGVTHFYNTGNSPAIININAVIRRGDFIAVVGANGSGKSTLARHMNALLLPSRGMVEVNGADTRDAGKIADIRRQVGMVFQNPDNQLVAALVEEDVAFGPENLGLHPEEIADRVDSALTAVGLEKLRNWPPHLLSGGQKQRLAIAGALAIRPGCLVLDEPTAMLDPGGRKEVLSLLGCLKKEYNMSVVLITHLMEEALLADRVWVMADGSIIADDSPRAVFRNLGLLEKAGLEPAPVTLMAARLRRAGWDVPEDILTLDELVSCICRL
jgi:energy-coupling factor transport system ATP-binding protein